MEQRLLDELDEAEAKRRKRKMGQDMRGYVHVWTKEELEQLLREERRKHQDTAARLAIYEMELQMVRDENAQLRAELLEALRKPKKAKPKR